MLFRMLAFPSAMGEGACEALELDALPDGGAIAP